MPLIAITAEVTQAEMNAAISNRERNPGIQAWISKAAQSGVTATLVGLPTDGYGDANEMLMALVRVGNNDFVLTITLETLGNTRTVSAREPRDNELNCFGSI